MPADNTATAERSDARSTASRPDRFGNLSTADLVVREIETRAEHKLLISTIKRRMIDESPIKLGRLAIVKSTGRKIVLIFAQVEHATWDRDSKYFPWHLRLGGHLENQRSTTGNGYNRKNYYTYPENLEEIAGDAGMAPQWALEYVECMKEFR